MRVGLVVYGGLDETSGGFRYDRQLVDYLRRRGDSVELISLPWRSYWRSVADGCRPAVTSQLNRPVDVLVQDELCHPSLWWANHRLTRPGAVVALVHHVQSDDTRGRLSWLRRAVERRYLASVDAAICTSEFTRQRARSLGGDLGRSLVAPPAGRIEGPALSERQIRQRATEEPFRIAFVGNLIPRKGVLRLLSAVDRAVDHAELTDWRLTVVGSRTTDPAYADRALDKAAELGIADSVEFTGEVSSSALTEVLEASHVLCVPSRYEGFGMVYLEAMEYGVVPIAGSHGGAGEFITDGDNGFLVAPGDTERIATLLTELAADRQRLADLGAAALAAATAHPTWDETLGEVRSLLNQLLTAEPSPLVDHAATDTASRTDESTNQGEQP